MSTRSGRDGGHSIGTDTWITIAFVVLGVASWLLARSITDSRVVQFAALIGVGVIAPTLITEWRSDRAE